MLEELPSGEFCSCQTQISSIQVNQSICSYILWFYCIFMIFFLHFVVTPPCWSSPPSLLTPHWAPLHWFGLMTHPAAGGWVEDRWLFLWGKYFVWNWTWLLSGPPNPKFWGGGGVCFLSIPGTHLKNSVSSDVIVALYTIFELGLLDDTTALYIRFAFVTL